MEFRGHLYIFAISHNENGLASAIGEAHRQYIRRINFREKWRGHLWQERFAAFPIDELQLLAAARYVEMKPVAAGIVTEPAKYRWSSARAHLNRADDALAVVSPLLNMVPDWREFLRLSSTDELETLHLHEHIGHPLGSTRFVEKMEKSLGRALWPQKPGPKRKQGS